MVKDLFREQRQFTGRKIFH